MTMNIQHDYKWLQLKISDIKISDDKKGSKNKAYYISAIAQRYLSFQKSCFFHACYAENTTVKSYNIWERICFEVVPWELEISVEV